MTSTRCAPPPTTPPPTSMHRADASGSWRSQVILPETQTGGVLCLPEDLRRVAPWAPGEWTLAYRPRASSQDPHTWGPALFDRLSAQYTPAQSSAAVYKEAQRLRWSADCSERRAKGRQGKAARERASRREEAEGGYDSVRSQQLQLASPAEEEEAMALAAEQFGNASAAGGWMAIAEEEMDRVAAAAAAVAAAAAAAETAKAELPVVLAEPSESAAAQAHNLARSLDPEVLEELRKYLNSD